MPKEVMEIQGGIGELDYGGITLNVADKFVEKVARQAVAPEVRRRIDHITHATERAIKVKREGFFDPRKVGGGVAPVWSVYVDENEVEHGIILEYGHNGRNAFMRPGARARALKAKIRTMVKSFFGPQLKAQIRNAKRRKLNKMKKL